jgi:hypothetical protein
MESIEPQDMRILGSPRGDEQRLKTLVGLLGFRIRTRCGAVEPERGPRRAVGPNSNPGTRLQSLGTGTTVLLRPGTLAEYQALHYFGTQRYVLYCT